MPIVTAPRSLTPETMQYRKRNHTVAVTLNGQQFHLAVRLPSLAAIHRYFGLDHENFLIEAEIALPEGIRIDGFVDGSKTVMVNVNNWNAWPEFDGVMRNSIEESICKLASDLTNVALFGVYARNMSRVTYDFLLRHIVNTQVTAEPGESLHDLLDVNTESLGWTNRMSAFQTVYASARDNLVDGKAVFSEVEGDPMHGFAALYLDGFDGRTFGLEIEVDFPESYPYNQQKNALAQRLYDEGFTDSPDVHGWHWRGREVDNRSRTLGGGYVSTRDGWSVEFDRSTDDVGGQRGCEIVSPIMSNTREWWTDIAKILSIIKELGGVVTTRHGLHVNLGARDFTDLATRNLYTIARDYDALLVRMSHNPFVAPRHRGRNYCNALDRVTPTQGNNYFAREAVYSATHRHLINLASFHGNAENKRVEFRSFDASLDVLRIQRYVMIAMAMMHNAVSATEAFEEKNAYTTYVNEFGRNNRRRTGTAWVAATLPVREFVDRMHFNSEAAQDIVALFTESRY